MNIRTACLLVVLLFLFACTSSEPTSPKLDTVSQDAPSVDTNIADVTEPDSTASPTDAVDAATPDSSDTATPPVDAQQDTGVEEDMVTVDEGPPPPPVEATFSTLVGDWEMAPGDEVTKCVVKRLDNETEVWVTKIRTILDAGSHHMIVYRSDDTEEQPEPFNCTPFTETLAGETVPLVITQIAEETLALPNGVAFRFEPNQMVRIEAHFLNYYPETITAHGDVHFDTIAFEDMEHEANLLFYGTTDVDLPPNSESQTPWYFLDVPEETKLFAITGHVHQLGTNVEIQFANSLEDPLEDIYPLNEIFNWQEAPVIQFDPPLVMEKDQGFRYRCSWNNTTNQNIGLGESGNDEMCFLWAYYYPSYGYRICINLGDTLGGVDLGGLGNLIGDSICCPGSPLCDLVKGYIKDGF